jgi:hypothetical protein
LWESLIQPTSALKAEKHLQMIFLKLEPRFRDDFT